MKAIAWILMVIFWPLILLFAGIIFTFMWILLEGDEYAFLLAFITDLALIGVVLLFLGGHYYVLAVFTFFWAVMCFPSGEED